MKEKVELIGREFRFAFPILTKNREEDDYHLVKEQVHYRINGEVVIKPEMRAIKNFKRPVYVTRKNLQTHKEKREFEFIENLQRVDTRQSELKLNVAKMTNTFNYHASLKEMCASPYIYAADIPSTLILRKELYKDRWPNLLSYSTVACFDTESCMERGDIIITSACFKNEAYIGIVKRKLEGYSNPGEKINEALNRHLEKYIKERDLKIFIYVAEDEIDLLKDTFKKIHSWRPDFLAIWNMNWDVPLLLDACKRANVDPVDIFCDPNLPDYLKFSNYKAGQTSQPTSGGKTKLIKPANQWHTWELAASFYVIDMMCVYRRIRGGAELPNYNLDSILTRELNLTKIRIPKADKLKKGKWHEFMQFEPGMIFDYMAYGLFDSYSMILLDEKTKDLSQRLPFLADFTSYADYASQTKRLRDNFYLFGLEKGVILGSLGPKKKDPKKPQKVYDDEDVVFEDEEELELNEDGSIELKTLDRRDWVVTLKPHLSNLGQAICYDEPSLSTLIRAYVYDSDVVSSYPNCTLVANVSKRTRRKEICRIGDIPESVFRMQNLNFIFGHTNAAEYTQNMFKAPNFQQLNAMFAEHLKNRR